MFVELFMQIYVELFRQIFVECWVLDFRDEAVDRKNDAEVELARCRIESMQVNYDDDDDDYHNNDDYGADDDDGDDNDHDEEEKTVFKIMSISTALVTLGLI